MHRKDPRGKLTLRPVRMSVVTLQADVVFRGERIADGKRVSFSADATVLFDDLADIDLAGGARLSVVLSNRHDGAERVLNSLRDHCSQSAWWWLSECPGCGSRHNSDFRTLTSEIATGRFPLSG